MRTMLVLLIGALAGASLTYFLAATGRIAHDAGSVAAQRDAVAGSRPEAAPANASESRSGLQPRTTPPVADRLAIYERAAASDTTDLVRDIAAAAREPASPTRAFTLDVLLARLAEIDPAEAVRVARAHALDTDLAARLHAVLAGADFEAALDSLTTLDDARAAEAAGLAVLAAMGYGERALERVVAALPAVDADDFVVAAYGEFAAVDAEAAFARALVLGRPRLRARAVAAVARAWAGSDPHAALARAESIADAGLERTYRTALFDAWMSRDAVAALRYALPRADAITVARTLSGASATALASADPRALLDVAASLDRNARRLIEQVALRQLAAQDLDAALAYAESQPAGPAQERARAFVARGLAAENAEAALAWVRSLEPPDPNIELHVLVGIAGNDLTRAVELAVESPTLDRASALQQIVLNAGPTATDAEFRHLADVLLAQPPGTRAQSALQALAAHWRMSDPRAALDWLVANEADMPLQTLQSAAFSLTYQEPELAAEYVDRVPDALRASWIESVAQGYANEDPERAARWIEQFRGEPVYGAGVAAVAAGLAQTDPPRAARLLDTIAAEPAQALRAASVIATRWAERDAYAAAQWAAGLPAPDVRGQALQAVAQQWARRDAQGAQSWALGLPRGEERDRVLGATLTMIASTTLPDDRLLDAFSTGTTRERYAASAVSTIAQRDEAAARAFMEEHVTDPAMRERAERMLERGSATGRFVGPNPTFGVGGSGAVIEAFPPGAAIAR